MNECVRVVEGRTRGAVSLTLQRLDDFLPGDGSVLARLDLERTTVPVEHDHGVPENRIGVELVEKVFRRRRLSPTQLDFALVPILTDFTENLPDRHSAANHPYKAADDSHQPNNGLKTCPSSRVPCHLRSFVCRRQHDAAASAVPPFPMSDSPRRHLRARDDWTQRTKGNADDSSSDHVIPGVSQFVTIVSEASS